MSPIFMEKKNDEPKKLLSEMVWHSLGIIFELIAKFLDFDRRLPN